IAACPRKRMQLTLAVDDPVEVGLAHWGEDILRHAARAAQARPPRARRSRVVRATLSRTYTGAACSGASTRPALISQAAIRATSLARGAASSFQPAARSAQRGARVAEWARSAEPMTDH